MIQREVRGRIHVCRLDPGPLATAHEWLAFYQRFWNQRLDVLEHLLRKDARDVSPARKTNKTRTRKGHAP